MLDELRKKIPIEEFDYLILMEHLKGYKKPRDKVTQLLRSGDLVRVKKGIYVFGPKYRNHPVCLEVLANQIYGPSYISLEYALSYYGMIPERVETITSITSQKTKSFHTPFGLFSYKHINPDKYSVGVESVQLDDQHFCLIASQEKALADRIASQKNIKDLEGVGVYLIKNLRIDVNLLKRLDYDRLDRIAKKYNNAKVTLLAKWISKIGTRQI